MIDFRNKLRTLLFYLKPRKIVAQYKLFFGDEWLELSVDSIAPYVFKILLVISDVPWGEDKSIKGDDLEPIIDKLRQKYPEKILIYKGSWNKQLEQVQAGLDYIKRSIPETSHCLYIDADEIYKQDQIKRLLALTKKPKYFNKSIRINSNCYFKSIYIKIFPNDAALLMTLFPVRNYVSYYDARNVTSGSVNLYHYFFEHFAYVRKDEEKMKNKIATLCKTENVKGDWYQDVWLKWTSETKNFHPVRPEEWKGSTRVLPNDLPLGAVERYSSWK